MYTKKFVEKDGTKVTATYQSWYEVWWEGWLVSGIYFLSGLIGFFITPFMAIRAIFNPPCISYHGEYRSDR